MKLTLKHALAAAILILNFAAPVAAGPFEDGQVALKRGDYATAMRLLRPLADQGNALSQLLLGDIYENGLGVPQNYAAAMSWLRKAADQGDSFAQYSLGEMYGSGRGVPKNYPEALKWYRLAANQGNADAELNLGVMYANGQAVPQDYAQAEKWFRKAAEQGNADAQLNLGKMYGSGRGVPLDLAQAAKWVQKAAEQGRPDAQSALASMYILGKGVPQDYAKAAKWARMGAERGDGSEQFLLGSIYVTGKGAPKDYVSAYMWLNLAAAKGETRAVELRDKVARLMTPAQIAEAQKLAREWKPTKQLPEIQNAHGETAEEKLSLATNLVVNCYIERYKIDVAKRMTPKAYETSIHTECFERENFLKLIVNDTVDPNTETPELYLTKLRQTSVVKYFIILGLLFPELKDRCGGGLESATVGSSTFDKIYACVITQK